MGWLNSDLVDELTKVNEKLEYSEERCWIDKRKNIWVDKSINLTEDCLTD